MIKVNCSAEYFEAAIHGIFFAYSAPAAVK